MTDILYTLDGRFTVINEEMPLKWLYEMEKDLAEKVMDFGEDEGMDSHGNFRVSVFESELWDFYDIMNKYNGEISNVTIEGMGVYGESRKEIQRLAEESMHSKIHYKKDEFMGLWNSIRDIIYKENEEVEE